MLINEYALISKMRLITRNYSNIKESCLIPVYVDVCTQICSVQDVDSSNVDGIFHFLWVPLASLHPSLECGSKGHTVSIKITAL